jgi:hypothetical protein
MRTNARRVIPNGFRPRGELRSSSPFRSRSSSDGRLGRDAIRPRAARSAMQVGFMSSCDLVPGAPLDMHRGGQDLLRHSSSTCMASAGHHLLLVHVEACALCNVWSRGPPESAVDELYLPARADRRQAILEGAPSQSQSRLGSPKARPTSLSAAPWSIGARVQPAGYEARIET